MNIRNISYYNYKKIYNYNKIMSYLNNEYKSTIVTMFFDLTELKDSTHKTRNAEFYLNHGRAILQLENPMIIFCDSKTKPRIKEIRDELIGENNLTIYIEKNISEYDFYKNNWGIVQKNRQPFSYYLEHDYTRVTVSHSLTVMFKIFAIQIAAERNDFNTTHYVWMDFGCNHIAPYNIKEASLAMLNNPHPKVGILYIHYRGRKELENMILFCNSGICSLATTIFTVQKEYVSLLYTSVLSVFYEQLFNHVLHTDEQVFIYVYDRNPELMTIYYGDYYSVITNYHKPVRDWHSIKWCFIESALMFNRLDLAKEASRKVYDSVMSGLITDMLDEDILYFNRY